MQVKSLTRSFALFSLVPIGQLVFDQVFLGTEDIPRTQLASMIILCVGSLMISLFADTSSFQRKPFSWFAENSHNNREASGRVAVIAIEGIEIRDNGRNSVIRLPVQNKH